MIKLISFSLLAIVFGIYGITIIPDTKPAQIQSAEDLYQYKLLNVVSCSPDFPEPFDNSISIPLLKGWGNHQMKISTNDDSAFVYFNQGINMFYGFHFIEARASFKKAQGFDTLCAMAYLGEALTYGPNINNPAYKLRSYTSALVQKATQLSSGSEGIEKALIDAQLIRYNTDTSEGLQQVNETYAKAMETVYKKYPSSSDAGALYADALLQLHPWNLYDNTGNPRPWTAFIEGEFEKLMKQFPDHPGLNHYYIHCVEASNTAYRGLESARKLQLLTPGLSHMLHMSSHIFIRTGHYKEGVEVNQKAINAFEQYKKIYPDVEKYIGIYYKHNLAMGFANAMFLPDYRSGQQLAQAIRSSVTKSKTLNDSLSISEQYSYSSPYLAWIRYGKWDSILIENDVPGHLVYASFLQHFAKGMALARKRKSVEAEEQLSEMDRLIDHAYLQVHPQGENSPVIIGKIAISVLKGVIAEEQGNLNKAIEIFQQAVLQEDAMDYNEPKDWLLPTRQYLGECLLKKKLYTQAESVFQQDLKLNPDNVWSLSGLYYSLSAQNKATQAKNILNQCKKIDGKGYKNALSFFN